MTNDELATLLEGKHCDAEVCVAIRLPDGQRLHASISSVAYRRFRKISPHGRLWILANEPWQKLTFDAWHPDFRAKP